MVDILGQTTMELFKEAIEEFKALYKKHFDRELSDQEALDKGTRLINLIKAVYKPMTQSEYKAVQKRRRETG